MAATTPSPTMVDDQGDQRCQRRQQLNEISVLSHSGQFPEVQTTPLTVMEVLLTAPDRPQNIVSFRVPWQRWRPRMSHRCPR